MRPTIGSASASLSAPRRQLRSRLLPRVLLVDDCPLQRLLGQALLFRWNIAAELACDGDEAVYLAAGADFDLILMDLNMPLVDGFAATRRIRLHERQAKPRRRVRIVAYTSHDSPAARVDCLHNGMDALLPKPSAAAEMGECLKRWCPNRLVVENSTD